MDESPKPPKLALFPVYLYEEGFELPTEGQYYVVTSEGVFFRKETKVGSGFVPVKGIPWLEKPPTKLTAKMNPIPGLIIGQALRFFRRVFFRDGAESYVTLMYSPKLKQYKLWCPTQSVSRGGVSYDRTDQPDFESRRRDEWQMVGTIHSHCDFSAFHSGTDTHDESTFDGVHITLGHVNRDDFSAVSSIALSNVRESLLPEETCLGLVRLDKPYQISTRKGFVYDPAGHYNLDLSPEDQEALDQFEETVIVPEWLPKVSKQTYRKAFGFEGGSGTFFAQRGNAASQGIADNDADFESEDSWIQRLYGKGKQFFD
jgi:hypothetical protein